MEAPYSLLLTLAWIAPLFPALHIEYCDMALSGSGWKIINNGPTGSFIYVVYITLIYCRPVVTSVLYK